MSSPSSRPATAATNSAVERFWTPRISQPAGTIVRYGRIAKPTTIHATTQAARKAPLFWVDENRPSPAKPSARPMMPPKAAPRMRMLRVTEVKVRSHRSARPDDGDWDAGDGWSA